MEYNLFSELRNNLEEATQDIRVVNITNEQKIDGGGNRRLSKDTLGYLFNQRDMIDTIDMMWNSKYKTGIYDENGQRKTFLNIVKFPVKVAQMQTDLDVSNFLFIPVNYESVNKTYFMQRQFRTWAKQKEYGQVLNDLNDDYSKYGTCVAKKVGDVIERVSLRDLYNTQSSKNLYTAALDGYVIQHHELNRKTINDYPNWDIEGVEFKNNKLTVYERYSLVPLSVVKEHNGEEVEDADKEEWVLAMQILAPNQESLKGKKGNEEGKVMFIEQIDEKDFPYEECHWEKQDGRWLGIGEVENQIENQIARNMVANLRRKALLWGGKKIFQSNGEVIAKNLVKDVQDGEVLEIGPNGQISNVPMESRSLAEFQQDVQDWDNNTRQTSFTFEVATGETMTSGTPFRLGVILNNSVQTHFGKKRENFGFFLQRTFFDQIIPIFKKETKAHTLQTAAGEQGTQFIMDAIISKEINKRFVGKLLNEDIERSLETLEIDFEAEKEKIRQDLMKSPYFFVKVPDHYYDDAEYYLSLEITGEGENIQKQVETLTTIWQALQQKGDPRADKILDMIMSYTGNNMEGMFGKTTPNQNAQGMNIQSTLQGLNNAQNVGQA